MRPTRKVVFGTFCVLKDIGGEIICSRRFLCKKRIWGPETRLSGLKFGTETVRGIGIGGLEHFLQKSGFRAKNPRQMAKRGKLVPNLCYFSGDGQFGVPTPFPRSPRSSHGAPTNLPRTPRSSHGAPTELPRTPRSSHEPHGPPTELVPKIYQTAPIFAEVTPNFPNRRKIAKITTKFVKSTQNSRDHPKIRQMASLTQATIFPPRSIPFHCPEQCQIVTKAGLLGYFRCFTQKTLKRDKFLAKALQTSQERNSTTKRPLNCRFGLHGCFLRCPLGQTNSQFTIPLCLNLTRIASNTSS